MKSSVAITLIVVGALLILSPMISMTIARQQSIAAISARTDVVELDWSRMDEGSVYRYLCAFSGAILVGLGIFYSIPRKGKVDCS